MWAESRPHAARPLHSLADHKHVCLPFIFFGTASQLPSPLLMSMMQCRAICFFHTLLLPAVRTEERGIPCIFSMTRFAPIGSTRTRFNYGAHVRLLDVALVRREPVLLKS